VGRNAGRARSVLAISAATLLWFIFIYTLIASGAYRIALYRIPDAVTYAAGRQQRLRPDQVRKELWPSALSIGAFALQTAGVVWLIRQSWLSID